MKSIPAWPQSPLKALALFLGAIQFIMAGPLLAAESDSGGSPRFWFGFGPAVRGGMSIDVKGSSYAQILGLHDPTALGPLTFPAGIGATNSYADRTYDNGYVRLDPGTGNPSSANPSGTWNWGFNNPAQYDATARTLSFQSQSPAGYVGTASGPAGSDSVLGAGVQVEAGVRLATTESWSVDLCLGFQGIWNGNERFSTTTYSESVQQIAVTDVYDVSGIAAADFPANGFHGTFLGPFDNPPVVPSPQIPNQPMARSAATSAPTSTSANQIDFNVRQSLYQFSVGPHVTLLEDRGVKLYLRPSVAANIIDVSVQRSEVFVQTPTGGTSTVLGQWSDHGDHLAVSVGLGAIGGFDIDLGQGFFAGAYGGYDWVAEKVDVTVGPNVLSIDASGWVAGGVIGVRF